MLFDPNAALILFCALLLDAAIGDPDALWRRVPHPVVLMGKLIGQFDTALNRGGTGIANRLAGVAAIGVIIAIASGVGLLLHWLAIQYPLGMALEILLAGILLAQRSLYDHVARVRRAFTEGGLPAARSTVAMIVGRDPERLDEAGICRAAIETTAENFSDGIVAPAFWYLIAGLPGIIVYKAVNTADSMIGHRSPCYETFGWAAARLDDVLNLVPARLSGLMLVAAAFIRRDDGASAWSAMWEDAGKHRSPNAGWPEAAMAGALGVALAGPRHYDSGAVDDPWLNEAARDPAQPADIFRALHLMAAACMLQAVLIGVVALIA